MGKKNRNKKNRWKQNQLDSDQNCSWSVTFLDVRKYYLEFQQRNDDVISNMHDDILCRIISFLPFKSAVETSFLSTRWKELWKRNFSVLKGTMDDAFIAISSFLKDGFDQSRQTSNWGFQFHFGNGSFLTVAGEPDKALHLDLSNVKQEFPWKFDWLLEINGPNSSFYDWFHFWLYDYDQIHTPQPASFTFNIKTLHLKSVSHLTSVPISSMMSNFKLLEHLTVEKCNGLRSLHIKTSNSKLKKLTILDCQQLESVTLKNNSLDSLRYRGKLISFQCGNSDSLLGYWPWYDDFQLVDAMLDFRHGPAYKSIDSCGFESIFCRMKGVKSLTLCKWVFEALMCPMLPEAFFFRWELWFLKLTALWWIDYAKERYNCNALISFLKLCPCLIRLYITIDTKSYRKTYKHNNSVELMGLPTLETLKLVRLEGFLNENEEIILAKRLKQEFNVEPLIVAKSNYVSCVRILVKSREDDDEMLVKEGKKDSYKFIEARVEHLYDLCPKHVHMGF